MLETSRVDARAKLFTSVLLKKRLITSKWFVIRFEKPRVKSRSILDE